MGQTHNGFAMTPGDDWQSRCGIQKIVQTDLYGCGIASLAMVTGATYESARQRFNAVSYTHLTLPTTPYV